MNAYPNDDLRTLTFPCQEQLSPKNKNLLDQSLWNLLPLNTRSYS